MEIFRLDGPSSIYRVDSAQGGARFTISVEQRIVSVPRSPSRGDLETLKHLLFAQIVPRIEAHLGELVFHGGAITAGSGAIAFLGKSGAGKSTLSASFIESGHRLINDDAIFIEKTAQTVTVSGPQPRLRLLPDSLRLIEKYRNAADSLIAPSEKTRIKLSRDCIAEEGARELDAIFLLDEPAALGVEFSRCDGASLCLSLIENSFLLDPTDSARAEARLLRIAEIAECVPSWIVHYPRSHDSLHEVREGMLALAGRRCHLAGDQPHRQSATSCSRWKSDDA